jgi:UPF0755 protein
VVRRIPKFRPRKRPRVHSAALLVLVVVVIAGLWFQTNLRPLSTSQQNQVLEIKQGMTASQVAKELEDKKIIRSARAFLQLCWLQKADPKIVAGVYQLSPSMSAQEILDKLIKGPDKENIKVTIPEGYTVAQIVKTLASKELGTEAEFYRAMKRLNPQTYPFLKDIPQGENRLEGFLFPDTYFFNKGQEPEEIIAVFLKRFEKELTPETVDRLKVLNLSVYDWVTKASIVEREAVKPEERPLIAGVFNNRLQKGMPLQSCATVQYVLGEVKPVLSTADIEIDSPYNTYKNLGLPPGPIANPGRASLQAVLYPSKTDYLYFVAKSDKSHAFAVTHAEHLNNISKYQ